MLETYDDALNFIHGRTKFKKIPTLNRMRKFLDLLGSPDQQVKAVHIAGTNGKGSTLSFLRTILQTNGWTVGSFTSPFLIKFNERISVNGIPVSDAEILRLAQIVYPVAKHLDETLLEGGPTEFEIITAMMFQYFSEGHADIVLVEVGLGGLYDSTNVIVPLLSVITSIGWDHMKLLGNTLEKIAAQKAGIIKSGVPVVVGTAKPGPMNVITNTAKRQNSQLLVLNDNFVATDLGVTNWHQKFSFTNSAERFPELQTTLLGEYQVQNASLAIETALQIAKITGKPITQATISQGIADTKWAGRFEKLSDDPAIVIDGAHNISAVVPLVNLLRDSFGETKISILISVLADKEVDKMVEELITLPNVTVTLTHFEGPSNRTTANPQKVLTDIQGTKNKVAVNSDWKQAISEIKTGAF